MGAQWHHTKNLIANGTVLDLNSALKRWAAELAIVTTPRAHSPSRSSFHISGSIISHSEIVFLYRLFPTRLPPIVVVQLLVDIVLLYNFLTFLFLFRDARTLLCNECHVF